MHVKFVLLDFHFHLWQAKFVALMVKGKIGLHVIWFFFNLDAYVFEKREEEEVGCIVVVLAEYHMEWNVWIALKKEEKLSCLVKCFKWDKWLMFMLDENLLNKDGGLINWSYKKIQF